MTNCPCCSGKLYINCCRAFIEGTQLPKTAEELMRSRYCAYTTSNISYIAQTMKGRVLKGFDKTEAKIWIKHIQWLGLEILKTSTNHKSDFVEFIAHYTYQNIKQYMHEISEFHFEEGKWYYVDGKTPNKINPAVSAQIGRNDHCLCGSNKKYKKCCL